MPDDSRPSDPDRETHLRNVDVTTPNVARMYDYYLGGKDNFAVDREAAEEVLAAVPDARRGVQENRAFLGRAVRFLASEAGIRQFLDLGSGLPTKENTHQVAQKAAPGARVVYVDNDAVVLTHARALLATDAQTIVVDGDVRRSEGILNDPDLRRHIDLDQPVAILLVAMLHFVPDDEDAARIVATIRDSIAPGSYLVVSHVTGEDRPQEATQRGVKVYERATSSMTPRGREQVLRLFVGFDLVDPGIVVLQDWRPDAPPSAESRAGSWFYAAVGRKL